MELRYLKKLRKFSKTNIFLWLFIIIPGVPFILGFIGFFTYVHWPTDTSSVSELSIKSNTQYISLSVHGVNDTPSGWSDELQAGMLSNPYPQLNDLTRASISLDWRPFSNNIVSCSVTGKKIGDQIGKNIAKLGNVKGVHLIGHSCGSFVVYGACLAIKSMHPDVIVQTTYLDPVAVYSGVMWDYGLHHFGTCADFSDTYIDTGDGVPGSNEAMPHSVTFDVTNIRLDENLSYSPHIWPTRFYIRAFESQNAPVFFNHKSTALIELETSILSIQGAQRIYVDQ